MTSGKAIFLSLLMALVSMEAKGQSAPAVDDGMYLKQADSALREGRLIQAGQMILWLEHHGDAATADDVALLKAEYAIAHSDIATATAALATIKDATRNVCRLDGARGWLAANGNALDNAIVSLGNAVQNCPDDAGIWNLLGLVLIQKGEAAAAAEAFDNSLMLAPGEPDILNNHAVALLQKGEVERAGLQLEDAARRAPENRSIADNLDFVRGMQGMTPERQPGNSDAEWGTRLVNVAKGAKAASRIPQANALFSRALLTLDHFDNELWSEMTAPPEIHP